MRIFKYLHPDRIDVLESTRICFSSPQNLNDPFELRPPLRLYESDELAWEAAAGLLPQILEDTYAKFSEDAKLLVSREQLAAAVQVQMLSRESGFASLIKKLMPEIASRFNSATEQRIGILCLTESPDDLLMWAHYGCSHEGFVLEFDPEASFFHQRRSEKDEFRSLRPVIYSPTRPTLTFADAKDVSPLLTKSDHWSYEQEWRMMVDLNDASVVLDAGEKKFHLFDFPASAIKSVIFGSRMSQTKKHRILELIANRPQLGHITCFQAAVDDILFKLNIIPFVSS
ncbi:DUF2971 domain-containing protein [Pseudomonas putida]|nr:DUF2971 domain-containing protein [Pseudomonas putida]